ncbi:MAG: hypothetical protein RLZZ628_459 [Bacteroidota bacterium]|jgi:uncharacterized protein (DUF433 family)
MIANLITISPEIQSGTPVFSKTRVPVRILFDYLKNGDTIDEFLHDYPSVSKIQLLKILSFLENQITFTHYEENITG